MNDYLDAVALSQELPETTDGVKTELAMLLLQEVEEVTPDQLERLRDTLEEAEEKTG